MLSALLGVVRLGKDKAMTEERIVMAAKEVLRCRDIDNEWTCDRSQKAVDNAFDELKAMAPSGIDPWEWADKQVYSAR